MNTSSFEIERTIGVSADEAWNIIGAVSGVDKWLAPITDCRVEGDKRYCSTEEGSFEEDILNVDHDLRVLEYAIPQQHMIPVSNIQGKMAVTESNNGATINWSWTFEVLPENDEVAKQSLEMVGGMGIAGIEKLILETQMA